MKFTEKFLDSVDLRSVDVAREALWAAFTWDDSPQGHAAWWAVSAALDEIFEAKRGQTP